MLRPELLHDDGAQEERTDEYGGDGADDLAGGGTEEEAQHGQEHGEREGRHGEREEQEEAAHQQLAHKHLAPGMLGAVGGGLVVAARQQRDDGGGQVLLEPRIGRVGGPHHVGREERGDD